MARKHVTPAAPAAPAPATASVSMVHHLPATVASLQAQLAAAQRALAVANAKASVAAPTPANTAGATTAYRKNYAAGTVPPNATITVLVANPKRPGTACWHRYAAFANGQTVAQYKALVGPQALAEIRWCLQRGYIALNA